MDGIKAMTKKYFTFLLTCALSLMLLLGGVTVQAIPKNYVAIDINPSIELVTNQYDNVVSVNAVNKDAEKLISDLEIIGLKIKDAVKQIVEKSVEFGYIKADKANEILITGSISNKSKDILEKVDESVKETLEANKVHSEVVKQNIDVNDRLLQEAHENGVSAGKYSVIEKLVKGNSYISKEELAEVKIASLFAYAKENNINIDTVKDKYEDAVDKADDAEEDAKEAEEKAKEKEEEAKEKAREKEEKAAEKEREKAEKEAEKAREAEEKAEEEREKAEEKARKEEDKSKEKMKKEEKNKEKKKKKKDSKKEASVKNKENKKEIDHEEEDD